jgi:hypothetical protein
MKWPLVIAALVIASSVAHAEVGGGGSSVGHSSLGQSGSNTIARPKPGAPLTTQRDFGARPGAPGSSTYDPYAGLSNNGGVGTLSTRPTNPTTGLPLSDSPQVSTPSLDDVMPGATDSGLLERP